MSSADNPVPPSINEENEACLDAMLLSKSIVFPMILKAAIELDLFTIIDKAGNGAQISASEVASHLPTNNPDAPSMLDRMLRLLASHSVLTYSSRKLEDGRLEKLYGLTPASKYFIQNSPDELSLCNFSALVYHPAKLQVWLRMKDAILEGGDLFKLVHGVSMYQYMSNDPTYNNIFNRAMASMSQFIMKGILDSYTGYEGLTSLVDVGGGSGTCLHMITSSTNENVFLGIEHVGGDMFSSVPTADAIMIKEICHNWGDEKCVKLLKNCYEALPVNGKLIIITEILPEEPESSKTSMFVSRTDNTMFSQPSGKERTSKEYETLCKKAGFSNFYVTCSVQGIRPVIESYK